MRRLHVLGAVVGVTVAATLGAAAPAAADAGGTCSSGRACLFENYDFNNGNTDHWRNFIYDHGDFNQLVWLDNQGSQTSDHMDNETSSIKNRRGCTFTLWQDVGYGGAHSDFGAGVNDGYLANNNIGDNRASAIDIWCA